MNIFKLQPFFLCQSYSPKNLHALGGLTNILEPHVLVSFLNAAVYYMLILQQQQWRWYHLMNTTFSLIAPPFSTAIHFHIIFYYLGKHQCKLECYQRKHSAMFLVSSA
jgi:hypothetical protein